LLAARARLFKKLSVGGERITRRYCTAAVFRAAVERVLPRMLAVTKSEPTKCYTLRCISRGVKGEARTVRRHQANAYKSRSYGPKATSARNVSLIRLNGKLKFALIDPVTT